ncbi:MAG: putative rane protein [Anaerocolumna sp.]|jgi:hypothetical protein|nr:putative rane protein [Anaerocolumna sp.]
MKVLIDNGFNIKVILNPNDLIAGSIMNQKVEVKTVTAVEGVTKEGEVIVGGNVDGGYVDGGYIEGEIPGDMAATSKDPLLSSWTFVAGITLLTLAISVGLGVVLAKRKIKKGIELYED